MNIPAAVFLFLLSAGAFLISCFSFREKGFLLNNAYIFASKQERMNMDKKPHYRQTAIAFLLLGIIFLLLAVEALLDCGWMFYIVSAVILITVIYAAVSSIRIESRKKEM